jgi:hypothetical protein
LFRYQIFELGNGDSKLVNNHMVSRNAGVLYLHHNGKHEDHQLFERLGFIRPLHLPPNRPLVNVVQIATIPKYEAAEAEHHEENHVVEHPEWEEGRKRDDAQPYREN